MPVLERQIDADAFLELQLLPEYRGSEYELIDGEMVKMTAPGVGHGLLAGMMFMFLWNHVTEYELGTAAVEAGFRSTHDPNLVLRPDVAFISYAALPKTGRKGLSPVMPDLAVEIASPSDTRTAMRQKAELYLRNGTRLVWLVFPDDERVEVHSHSGQSQSLGKSETLTGGDVLPGFSLELGRLFAL